MKRKGNRMKNRKIRHGVRSVALTAGVLLAVILFNLLFLLQNVLDIEYLWSGAALPAGMSYAEYAHRGAYPLILTALLAGLLTLIAFRRQSTGAGWKWARILVYVWLLQNVFLVASSLLRLGK